MPFSEVWIACRMGFASVAFLSVFWTFMSGCFELVSHRIRSQRSRPAIRRCRWVYVWTDNGQIDDVLWKPARDFKPYENSCHASATLYQPPKFPRSLLGSLCVRSALVLLGSSVLACLLCVCASHYGAEQPRRPGGPARARRACGSAPSAGGVRRLGGCPPLPPSPTASSSSSGSPARTAEDTSDERLLGRIRACRGSGRSRRRGRSSSSASSASSRR